jgi:protein-disulfide isomerase
MQMRILNLNTSLYMTRITAFLFSAVFALTLTIPASSAPPSKSAWLSTYAQNAKGGFVIGNPAAATKVVEYASYTCPHCAHFEGVDAPVLKSQYVAGGKVSFEVRILARDPIDLTLAMLARCGGKAKFFGNHRMLMANQAMILGKANSITAATQAKLQKADYTGFMTDAYSQLGLSKLMATRGITDTQAKACVADKAALAQILAMTDEATGPLGFKGTPGFLLDGKVAENVFGWDTLQPLLAAK